MSEEKKTSYLQRSVEVWRSAAEANMTLATFATEAADSFADENGRLTTRLAELEKAVVSIAAEDTQLKKENADLKEALKKKQAELAAATQPPTKLEAGLLKWPEVARLAERMIEKLDDYNGTPHGWREDQVTDLHRRLLEEVASLKTSAGMHAVEQSLSDAADVANFAMMVADVAANGDF